METCTNIQWEHKQQFVQTIIIEEVLDNNANHTSICCFTILNYLHEFVNGGRCLYLYRRSPELLSLSLSSNEAIGTWLGRQIHAQEINVYADRHDPDCQIHNKTGVSIIRAQQVTEMEILNF